MKIHLRNAALVLLTAAVSACGDSVAPGALNETEAQELAGAIFSQSIFDALTLDYEQPALAPGGPQLATYSSTVDATGPCPLGGQVSISGIVDVETDDQTGAGSVDFGITLVHAACVVQGDRGNRFTLTGNPNLTFDFLMTTDGGDNAGFSGGMGGSIDWAMGNRDGVCPINFDFSGEATATTFSFETSGTVCGVNVSQSVNVSG